MVDVREAIEAVVGAAVDRIVERVPGVAGSVSCHPPTGIGARFDTVCGSLYVAKESVEIAILVNYRFEGGSIEFDMEVTQDDGWVLAEVARALIPRDDEAPNELARRVHAFLEQADARIVQELRRLAGPGRT